MSQTRQATSNPAFASTRITSQTTSDSSHSHSSGLLRLRGEDTPNADEDIASARHIRWSEDVIDNEGKGKKSSKGEMPLKVTHSLILISGPNCTQCAAFITNLTLWVKVVQNLIPPTPTPTIYQTVIMKRFGRGIGRACIWPVLITWHHVRVNKIWRQIDAHIVKGQTRRPGRESQARMHTRKCRRQQKDQSGHLAG